MPWAPKQWVVVFDGDAVIDFEDVKNRGERKTVFTGLDKLRALGPDLPTPQADQILYAEVAPDRSRKTAAAATTPERANPAR